MTTTRVLVAHDAGARIFENRGPGKGLVQLDDIAFEDGRRHAREIDADRPGRLCDRAGLGGRHASEPPKDAKQHAVEGFAKALALDLARAYHQGAFQQLVLVAPPKFLGALRESMDGPLQKVLVGTLVKDLPRASLSELRTHLERYLPC